jgi:hypothetical protein
VTDLFNPSYSGGSDQEDRGSKPAPGKNFVRLFFFFCGMVLELETLHLEPLH